MDTRIDADRITSPGTELSEAAPRPQADVATPGQAAEPTPGLLPPLAVSALMVTKADLVAALRVYVPHLTDVEPIDGDRFLLTLGAEHPAPNGRPG